MQLTRYSDYSLRVLIYLALDPERLVTIEDIAQSYGISKAHLMKVVHQLGLRGYVETVFGRRLYLEYIRAGNQAQRAGAERAAINAPMQGTAADIIKRAMISVDGWLAGHRDRALMILQVHDELVFEADESFVPTLVEEAGRLMASAAQLSVPLVVDSGTGNNWDEAH